jgi:type I restriction enzyme S subunit
MGEVTSVVGGGTPSTADVSNYENGKISWITPADLSGYREKFISRGQRSITNKGLQDSGARLMPKGTVLFSSRAPIGYVAIAANELATNQGFKSFIPPKGVLPDYLYYYLQRAKELAIELASGTTFLEISGKKAALIPLPLAPVSEQHRIVAEIEQQFTRLDAAVVALKRVQANLKRYRASVLKAACEGRLVPTEAELARKEGRDYEPADQLLARILKERRAKWEADQLAKIIAAGKPPTNEDWKKKYKEPTAPDKSNLPKGPEGWAVASLEQLTSPTRVICYGILMPKDNVVDGVLYVKVKDIKGDRINISNLHRTSYDIAREYERASLKSGDLLLAIRGTYGRVAVVPVELEGGNITQDTARLDVSSSVDQTYIATYLRSPNAQNFFKRVARGVAVKGVNVADIRLTPVLLPPVSEQRRIAEEVDRCTSFLDEIQRTTALNVQRTIQLRQAILRSAFSGKLVPQDPNDQPASVLLERIRAERERANQRPKRNKKQRLAMAAEV